MRNVRPAAVAGRFYPADPRAARDQFEAFERSSRNPEGVQEVSLCLMAPHAGWVYSGAVAAQALAHTRVPDRVIIMCPNHTGLGVRGSVWAEGAYQIFGREVPIDTSLADALLEHPLLEADREAHLREHAIEVLLAMLVLRNPSLRVVPIVLAGLSASECVELGEHIGRCVQACPDEVLVVASTDMSHFHDADTARRLDARALEPVLARDPVALHERVRGEQISMCGYIPTAVALASANARGASEATLHRHAHSGEVSGDNERVVGYAGVTVR